MAPNEERARVELEIQLSRERTARIQMRTAAFGLATVMIGAFVEVVHALSGLI